MNNINILSSALLAGLLVFTGCGSSSNDTDPVKKVDDPHPGETAEQVKSRYLADIKSTNKDLNLSNTTISTNLTALAECLYDKDKTLDQDDILSTFGSGVREEDLNATSGINCESVTIRKVGGTFTSSENILYYSINNPITNNEQLLAYDYDNGKAHVVNTNVILKKKVFIYDGVKEGDQAKYNAKKYGLYLDPEVGRTTKTGIKTEDGQDIPYAYNLYTDSALLKFDAKNPTSIESIFTSSQIPTTLKNAGVSKLGGDYTVLENIVDVDNSYITLTAFDALADEIAGENEEDKKQVKMTVRLGDSAVVAGDPIVIEKGSDLKTTAVLVSASAPYTPKNSDGVYALMKYDKALSSGTKIADGRYYFATQSDDYIYLHKVGSNKLFAYQKGTSTLTEVTGITLAGVYDHDIHSLGSRHGSSSDLIDGGTTVSGRNPHLSDGTNGYLSFHYDLQENVGSAFIFGPFGAYKSAQVFKLTAESGIKIFDNGDGADDSLNPANTEPINGHVNLIAVSGDKLYTETGWYDGNATLGGECTAGYPRPMSANGKACVKVKYGYLDTSVTNTVADTTMLNYDDNNNTLDTDMLVTNLPYFVSRRVAPLASGDKLYISLFAGGSKAAGYKYKQYIFDLGESTSTTVKDGRTYFAKTAYGLDGVYDGKVMAWDANTQTIKTDDGTLLADTSLINGKPGQSISATTDGVPLSGIGTIGMLRNNVGNHAFELFAIDTVNGGIKAVDFAPFGGWIYE